MATRLVGHCLKQHQLCREPLAGTASAMQRGALRIVNLVISDAREELEAAIAKILMSTWQLCRVIFCTTPLPAYAPGRQRQAIMSMFNTIFVQEKGEAVSALTHCLRAATSEISQAGRYEKEYSEQTPFRVSSGRH